MPEVSVVIPTYNRAPVLSRAIDSVLTQTHRDLELIVVDDGSTDETDMVLESYEDDRLCVLETRENSGANAARNKGIQHASGKFISFLDSDDEYTLTHLEEVLSKFRESPSQVGGVYTSYRKLDNGVVVDSIHAQERVTLDDIRHSNPVGSFSATTFSSEVFDVVGLLDETLPAVQDYEFYLRTLQEYEIRGIPEPLLDRHIDGERIGKDPEKKIKGHQIVIDKHGEMISQRRRGEFASSEALIFAANGQRNLALNQFKRALQIDPKNWRHYLYYYAIIVDLRVLQAVLGAERRVAIYRDRIVRS